MSNNEDDDFKRYCIKQVRKERPSGHSPKKKYLKIADIPKPLYFVTLHPLSYSNYVIYEVDVYTKTEPTVRKAKSVNSGETHEFKWIDAKQQWVEVIPGTRQTVKDGPIVLPFYLMDDIEQHIIEVPNANTGKLEKRFKYKGFRESSIN
jgi:hypothetical protein